MADAMSYLTIALVGVVIVLDLLAIVSVFKSTVLLAQKHFGPWVSQSFPFSDCCSG